MFRIQLVKTEREPWTYHKWISTIIFALAVAGVICSYYLAIIGRTEIASDLSEQMVKVIFGDLIQYSIKAFGETFADESNKTKIKIAEMANGSPTVEDNVAG